MNLFKKDNCNCLYKNSASMSDVHMNARRVSFGVYMTLRRCHYQSNMDGTGL